MASKKLTPAFAAGLEHSGKPVRQHALVKIHWHALPRLISLRQTHPFQIQRVSYLKPKQNKSATHFKSKINLATQYKSTT